MALTSDVRAAGSSHSFAHEGPMRLLPEDAVFAASFHHRVLFDGQCNLCNPPTLSSHSLCPLKINQASASPYYFP
jgi:hypothetical protein